MADWENRLGQESPLTRALRLAMPDDLRNPLLHPEAVNHFALPPQQPRAELRNLPPRPGDYLSPVSEALSPTMGAYGLGNALGDAYVKGREGDYKGMASPLAEILLSMAPVPGMKKGAMPPRVENPIKAYHGAKSSYGPEDTYNPRKSQYRAFFAAEAPDLANSFARSYADAPRVYPVDISPSANLFDPRSNPAHGAALAEAIDANPSIVSGSLLGKETLKRMALSGDGGLMEFPGVQQWLKKNKFDGWRFEDTAAPPGIENRNAIGMLKPGFVRSSTTGGLVYGGLGAAVLPDVLWSEDQK